MEEKKPEAQAPGLNREAINDAVHQYSQQSTGLIAQRRLSGIKLANPPQNATQPWQIYQRFVLHTCDEDQTATFGTDGNGNPLLHPSHAIAYRTVDPTESYTSSQRGMTYGGGKLGIYSYWDTCDAMPPIKGLVPPAAAVEYEFYNYSQHPPGGSSVNPGETGNQAFDPAGSGSLTTDAQSYLTDFGTSNVVSELYPTNLTNQVSAAVTVAFSNYIAYLKCLRKMTGPDGKISTTCYTTPTCPPTYKA